MSEDPLKDCPLCNKSQLQKQVSAAGFQLKGSGWYKTDYTGKKEPKKENAAGDSKGSTEKTEKKKETDEKRT
jgi:predicted nucleic acid-binding Zn ribbon protein